MYHSILLAGDFTLFSRDTFRGLKRLWARRAIFLQQCEFIGVSSTGIIVAAALFMGAVLGYQLYIGFAWVGAEELVGASVGVALFRDLAAVMASFMVTGRAGAAMAAELATMRITEQIDALEVMAVDPMEYLIAPRVTAGFLMMPILGILFAGVASVAAAGVACGIMGLSYANFWDLYTKYVDSMDLVHCVVKSAVFGLVLTSAGCFNGYRAQGGASAVGFATRNTVVAALLGILLSDYVLTSLLPFGLSELKVS